MKSKNTLLIIMGICLVAGVLITGCTQQTSPAQVPAPTTQVITTTAPVSAGMANPASVSCGKIGGTTEIKKDAQGNEYGMCTFTNGTTCEEWALFRNEGCKPFTPVTTTTAAAVGMANPASVNCGKVGATSEILSNPDGSQYGMCKFPNGTACEEWALFRGEGCKPNVAPTATRAK
jgi:putative hemolysin